MTPTHMQPTYSGRGQFPDIPQLCSNVLLCLSFLFSGQVPCRAVYVYPPHFQLAVMLTSGPPQRDYPDCQCSLQFRHSSYHASSLLSRSSTISTTSFTESHERCVNSAWASLLMELVPSSISLLRTYSASPRIASPHPVQSCDKDIGSGHHPRPRLAKSTDYLNQFIIGSRQLSLLGPRPGVRMHRQTPLPRKRESSSWLSSQTGAVQRKLEPCSFGSVPVRFFSFIPLGLYQALILIPPSRLASSSWPHLPRMAHRQEDISSTRPALCPACRGTSARRG